MLRNLLRRFVLGLAIPLLLVSTIAFFSVPLASASHGFAFTTFKLGDFNPPGAPGTVCPQSTENQACTNSAAEPQIRADPAGNFYGSSEHGLGGGTDAWRSSDGGQHYVTLVSPNAGSKANNTGFAPGGGDTDLATAPVKNSAGNYNVYVSSLSLANVDVSTSTDNGNSWALNPTNTVSYGHQFVNVSIDQAGNVYSVFSDNHNLFYSFSTDQGAKWSAPVQVNSGTSKTAIEPWSVANGAGHVDIVWYGTSYYDGVNPPDSYPASAIWYVYMAQNLHATGSGSSFTQVQATPEVHSGGVCEGGITCTGNRDLFDDFGVAVNPITGLASIIYSDDQYTNDVTDPPQSGCTPSQNDTASCDHTSIATQTSGPGL